MSNLTTQSDELQHYDVPAHRRTEFVERLDRHLEAAGLGTITNASERVLAGWCYGEGYRAAMDDIGTAMEHLARELNELADPPAGLLQWAAAHPELIPEHQA